MKRRVCNILIVFCAGFSNQQLTLLHFSLQLAVQSDHHLMVFSIWAALARASSSSLSLSSSLLSQSAPAPSPTPMTPKDPSPRPPRPGDSNSGGLELGVPPVGLGVWVRLSGERIPLSDPRPRLHSKPPPADLPPSDRWGLGVWFMLKVVLWTRMERRMKGVGGREQGDSGEHHPLQSVINLKTDTVRRRQVNKPALVCTAVHLMCLEFKKIKKTQNLTFTEISDTLRCLWGGKALLCFMLSK